MTGDDVSDVEEQVPLLKAAESVRPSERVLFRNASDRKRLAGKAGQKKIVRGNGFWFDERDVLRKWVIRTVPEVHLVRLTAELVPFTRQHTTAADRLHTEPQSSDPREQIDEP